MNIDFSFICNSVLLGVGLAMDAFSVSIANALHDSRMSRLRMCGIAGTFAFFQFLMPVIGWLCVRAAAQAFQAFQAAVPWIALILLCLIGGKMVAEGREEGRAEPAADRMTGSGAPEGKRLGLWALFLQGIATSIDALSVGFTIADYHAVAAFLAAGIIAVVTFAICIGGLLIGKRAGMRLTGRASILGGVILIGIGIEILLKHLL